MNLSEKIAIVRKARRYTQEELGDKVGVSRQTVSSWEKGDYEPTLDNIRAITEALNVSFDTLLNDKVDLNDKQELNIALKNLDEDTKRKGIVRNQHFQPIISNNSIMIFTPD